MFQGLLVKKSALVHIDYLDEKIISFQEWDTSIRLSQNFSFAFVPRPTFIYHCHGDETISKNKHREALGYEKIVKKHEKGIIRILGRKGIARHYKVIGHYYLKAGEIGTAKKYFIKALLNNPRYIFSLSFLKSLKSLIRIF
jgi:hypothetical protein